MMFFDKTWTVGKVLDASAAAGSIQNLNNKPGAEVNKTKQNKTKQNKTKQNKKQNLQNERKRQFKPEPFFHTRNLSSFTKKRDKEEEEQERQKKKEKKNGHLHLGCCCLVTNKGFFLSLLWCVCVCEQKLYLFSLKTGAILPNSSRLCDLNASVLETAGSVLLERTASVSS